MHFFADCMEFPDPNTSYLSSEQDGEDIGGVMLPFGQYNDEKLAFDGVPPSLDGRFKAKTGAWDGYVDDFEPMAADADQKPLFVDPGLYDGESENEEIKDQIQALSMEVSRPSTRRASSSSKSATHRTPKSESASTDITPPDQEPPKKRKSRKAKKGAGAVVEEHRRSKFLERNRLAASKCREKKKQFVSDLEETKIALERQNAHLHREYNGLLGEVSGLKHHLMTHAKCNDPNIDLWLNNEATRFVQSSDMPCPPFGQFGQPVTSTASVDSPRSRNPSIASAYQALPGVFEPIGPEERQGSISYPHGELAFRFD